MDPKTLVSYVKAAIRLVRRKWPNDDEYESIALSTVMRIVTEHPEQGRSYILKAVQNDCLLYYNNEMRELRAREALSSMPAPSYRHTDVEHDIDSIDDERARFVVRLRVEYGWNVDEICRRTKLSRSRVESWLAKAQVPKDWAIIREKLGLSIDDFAKAAGFLTPVVEKFEAGKRVPAKAAKQLRLLYRRIERSNQPNQA